MALLAAWIPMRLFYLGYYWPRWLTSYNLMSVWTNQICILYWNLPCTMYCTLYYKLYFTLKWTKNCTHRSKWLVWLTFSTRNIHLRATYKFYLTLDSILSWTLYCILYCKLHCTLYIVPYTILFSNSKWLSEIPKFQRNIFLPTPTKMVLNNVFYNVLNTYV